MMRGFLCLAERVSFRRRELRRATFSWAVGLSRLAKRVLRRVDVWVTRMMSGGVSAVDGGSGDGFECLVYADGGGAVLS